MILNQLKQSVLYNLKNIPGKNADGKIVIFECDDWGGIRMPSGAIYNKLTSAGIPFSKGHFDKYDTIEDKADLETLFEVLLNIKDKLGNPAVMTPFVNVANPDFEKIKESGFEHYIYENYTQTLNRNGRESNLISLWQKGIELKIFVPEYHGREHITVPLWMSELKNGNKHLRKAFEYEYTSVLFENIHPVARGFRAEFYFENNNQKQFLAASIKDGAILFEKMFGYIPTAFVPGNGVFHPDFEQEVLASGIKYLNVNHLMPVPDGSGNVRNQKYYYTHQNAVGMTKYLRNCAFEPSADGYQGIGQTMSQVSAAFRWSKPAIISTHRVNFVGSIDIRNRDHGLRELQKLLQAILNRWPDVKFMSTKDFIQQNLT
jgi:hypothetical protein